MVSSSEVRAAGRRGSDVLMSSQPSTCDVRARVTSQACAGHSGTRSASPSRSPAATEATAGAHGVGTFELCVREAYRGVDYGDPASVERFAHATATCSAQLGRDLTSPQYTGALRSCLAENVRRTLDDPAGWGPIFVTGDAWRCVFIVYLGRDFKIPPDPRADAGA